MEQRSYFKEFAGYTSQNVLGMIGLSCYILADTFFISKGLGADGLAALNLAIPVYSFIHGSGLMLGMGGATKYSIFKGQGSGKNACRVFTNTIFAGIIFAAVFLTLGLFFSRGITGLLGADAAVFSMTETYLRVILLFSPAFLTNDILICFVRNDGSPRLSMLAMLGGSFFNIILDYIFIFPLDMGIFGAVLATGLSPVISIAILSLHLLQKKHGFHFQKGAADFAVMAANISLGIPSLITEVSSGIVMILFNMIILSLKGNTGVAAYGVIANLSLVVVAVYTGIAQGIQPLISRACGYGDTRNIRRVLSWGLMMMLAVSAVIYTLIFFLADPLTGIFNSGGNKQLQQIASSGFRLYFLAAPFVGFNVVISVFFTSTERPLPAHLISLLRGFLLIIPLAFALSALMGITGMWLTFPITEGLVALFGALQYKKLSCKTCIS